MNMRLIAMISSIAVLVSAASSPGTDAATSPVTGNPGMTASTDPSSQIPSQTKTSSPGTETVTSPVTGNPGITATADPSSQITSQTTTPSSTSSTSRATTSTSTQSQKTSPSTSPMLTKLTSVNTPNKTNNMNNTNSTVHKNQTSNYPSTSNVHIPIINSSTPHLNGSGKITTQVQSVTTAPVTVPDSTIQKATAFHCNCSKFLTTSTVPVSKLTTPTPSPTIESTTAAKTTSLPVNTTTKPTIDTAQPTASTQPMTMTPSGNTVQPTPSAPSTTKALSGSTAKQSTTTPSTTKAPSGSTTQPTIIAPPGNPAQPTISAPSTIKALSGSTAKPTTTAPSTTKAPSGSTAQPTTIAPPGNTTQPTTKTPSGSTAQPTTMAPSGNTAKPTTTAPPTTKAPSNSTTQPTTMAPSGNTTQPTTALPSTSIASSGSTAQTTTVVSSTYIAPSGSTAQPPPMVPSGSTAQPITMTPKSHNSSRRGVVDIEVDKIEYEDISDLYDDTNQFDIQCLEFCNITMNETTVPSVSTTTESQTTTTPRHRSIDLSGKLVDLNLVIVVKGNFIQDLNNTNTTVYKKLANQFRFSLNQFYSRLLPAKFKKIVILGFFKGSIKCNYLLEMNAPINESNANSTLQILRNVNWTTNSLTNLTLDVNKTTTAQANLLTNDSVFLPANVCVNNEVLEWDNDGNPICKYKCDTPVYKDICGDHGECSFTYGGVLRCICKDGYSDNKCETPKSTTTTAKPIKPDAIALSKIDIIGIAGGIGGGLVLILLVALCCVYTKLNKAKKRDRFYGYMDNDKEFLHDENSRIENVPDLKNEYTNLGYQTEQNELQMQRFEPEGKNVEYEPGQRQGAYERDDKAYRQVEEPEGGNVLIYQPKHLNGPMERQSGASKFDEVEERSNPYRMMDTDTTYKIRRPTVNSDRNVPYN